MELNRKPVNGIIGSAGLLIERIGRQKSDLHHPGLEAIEVVQVPANGFIDDGCLGRREVFRVHPASVHSRRRAMGAR